MFSRYVPEHACRIDLTRLSTSNATTYKLQQQKHQKEAERVKVIDLQLFEREYLDNSEQHRTPYDMAHINAVREHCALRRDFLRTPRWKSRVENNARNEQFLVENRNLMSSPVWEPGVDANFTALARRRAEQRMRRERTIRSPE
ncbi:hypothetical protein LSM04_004265 [Trypanosoma melophagium]|uniref:uncharacterized protein n=1 Tax=Trypanosoma melophagium TaxID=715481 RepID=UPI003519F647|nr:hypothetical protein LSM04_004265 [Trypanosoma melophagium]